MKLFFLTPTLELHGGNIVLKKHAEFLCAQGHDVTIITTTKPVEVVIDPRIAIIQYQKISLKFFDFFTFQLPYLFRLKRCIQDLGDADYIIPIYAPLIIHAIFIKKKLSLSAKIVPLFQDSFSTLWVGPYIRFIVKSRYLKWAIDKTVAISKPVAEEYKKISGNQPVLVTNGIESEHFYVRQLPKSNYVLFVGRPNKPKGIGVFLKAVEFVRADIPTIQAKVVGPNLEPKTEKGVEYIRYTDREQLAELYSQALVYVNASYAESFALPPLEAMACKTATVITNTGGEQQYAQDGKNTTVVPVGEPKAMAQAIKELLTNDELRTRYEEEGVKTAAGYQWADSCRKFEQVLLENL